MITENQIKNLWTKERPDELPLSESIIKNLQENFNLESINQIIKDSEVWDQTAGFTENFALSLKFRTVEGKLKYIM